MDIERHRVCPRLERRTTRIVNKRLIIATGLCLALFLASVFRFSAEEPPEMQAPFLFPKTETFPIDDVLSEKGNILDASFILPYPDGFTDDKFSLTVLDDWPVGTMNTISIAKDDTSSAGAIIEIPLN